MKALCGVRVSNRVGRTKRAGIRRPTEGCRGVQGEHVECWKHTRLAQRMWKIKPWETGGFSDYLGDQDAVLKPLLNQPMGRFTSPISAGHDLNLNHLAERHMKIRRKLP